MGRKHFFFFTVFTVTLCSSAFSCGPCSAFAERRRQSKRFEGALEACAYDNVEKVEEYLTGGGDIERRDSAGWGLLHRAARANALDVVQLLVERGANLNALGDYLALYTPLKIAFAYDARHAAIYLQSFHQGPLPRTSRTPGYAAWFVEQLRAWVEEDAKHVHDDERISPYDGELRVYQSLFGGRWLSEGTFEELDSSGWDFDPSKLYLDEPARKEPPSKLAPIECRSRSAPY